MTPDRSRRFVSQAIASGKLVRPDACECRRRSKDDPAVLARNGRHYQAIQAHHEDHERPLDVVWVCIDCHGHLDSYCCGWPPSYHRDPDGKNWIPRVKARCQGWPPLAALQDCVDGRPRQSFPHDPPVAAGLETAGRAWVKRLSYVGGAAIQPE